MLLHRQSTSGRSLSQQNGKTWEVRHVPSPIWSSLCEVWSFRLDVRSDRLVDRRFSRTRWRRRRHSSTTVGELWMVSEFKTEVRSTGTLNDFHFEGVSTRGTPLKLPTGSQASASCLQSISKAAVVAADHSAVVNSVRLPPRPHALPEFGLLKFRRSVGRAGAGIDFRSARTSSCFCVNYLVGDLGFRAKIRSLFTRLDCLWMERNSLNNWRSSSFDLATAASVTCFGTIFDADRSSWLVRATSVKYLLLLIYLRWITHVTQYLTTGFWGWIDHANRSL